MPVWRLGQTEYEIALDRVMVRRSWRTAVLLPGLPLGIALVWWTIASTEPGPQTAALPIVATIVATALMIAGIFGAVSVPWLRPRTFACSAEGIRVDGVLIPSVEVVRIAAESILRRYKGQVSFGIFIAIATTHGARTRMEVIDYESPSHPEVDVIVRAMNGVLSPAVGGREASPPSDHG